MVECINAAEIEPLCMGKSAVSTGDLCQEKQLYPQLSFCMKKAESVDIIVSFLMESGVKYILQDLKEAVNRNIRIRILTGNYLGITEPSALYLLKREFGSKVELKFYNEVNRSFHAKAYIFHYKDYGDIFIGSSNISRSALTSGIEWNYRFSSRKDPENFKQLYETFLDLYKNHAVVIDDEKLKCYSKNWHKPSIAREWEAYENTEQVRMLYEPRGAQIEALYALENSRAEGAKKALIMAATGIGKTYLAAFDSKPYENILFVAHREEILQQAARSFYHIRHSDRYGFFNGKEKCTDQPVIFASVATLGRKEYLSEKYFDKHYFQYVIIDEFHHAVTDQYKNILNYFESDFLLGLTATPDRMDGKNIYELCDYNVPYEIDLKEGINREMLVPFHYYGIYDDIDYSRFHVVRGHYSEQELNKKYIGNIHRHELIYKYYMKYGSQKALGFCCSRAHAEEMAEAFTKFGIPSAAVYSNGNGEYSEERKTAIQQLQKGELRIIFSVDMFNEGVDIPEVDMIMFLRPTESPVVFMQQLGRGLRKSRNKKYLNVLDFIGNYENAGRVRFLLTGRNKEKSGFDYAKTEDLPDQCIMDFDMQLIDLFKRLDEKQETAKKIIHNEYFRIKETLQKTPSRMELYTWMDDEIYRLTIKNSKENMFKHYLNSLNDLNELSDSEKNLYHSIGSEFLQVLETTSMSKVYKMPVLMAFYNHGKIRMNVTDEEMLESWKEFFDKNGNWKDLSMAGSYEEYRNIKDAEHLKKIITMPVRYLQKSGKGFFVKKTGYLLSLSDELKNVIKDPAFSEHMKDIIEYRTMDYYERRYLSEK